MRKLLADPNLLVVATVALKGGGFIEEAKKQKDIQLIELTPDNRAQVPESLLQQILQFIQATSK